VDRKDVERDGIQGMETHGNSRAYNANGRG